MTARGCTEKQERVSPSDAEGGARIFAEEKREMGHLLCFYLLELGMAAAWCRWVICREVDLPALLRTARTVWSGERQVLGELLLVRRRWTEGEETERFRQAWRRIALRLLPPLLYLTLGGALAPVLAWSMFPEGAGQLAMGCCVLAGLAGGCFKAGTQRTVEELSWMQGELEGLRFRPGFLKEHTRPVEWDQKKRGLLVLLLLAAAAVFGTIWGLSHSLAAAGPVGEAAALVLLALLWLLSEQPWRKKKGRSAAAEPGVTIQGSSLERYQEALEDFCRAMKIPALLVTETQEGTVNASARLSPGQVPELRVTGGLLKQAELLFQRTGNLEQMDRTVLSILGHELSHIAHRDALQLERRARKAALVSGGIFLLLAGSVLLLPAAAPLPALLLVLYLGADLLFGKILTDRRFWGQMCELRADRTGLRLSGASGEEWMQFWEIARLLQAEEKRQARLRGENVLYQGYRRYLRVEFHPSLRRRRAMMERGRPWGWRDYLDQLWYLRMALWQGRGWNE